MERSSRSSNNAMEASSNRELAQLFECPVCFDYVLPPIMQCNSGHLVCQNCQPKLTVWLIIIIGWRHQSVFSIVQHVVVRHRLSGTWQWKKLPKLFSSEFEKLRLFFSTFFDFFSTFFYKTSTFFELWFSFRANGKTMAAAVHTITMKKINMKVRVYLLMCHKLWWVIKYES